MIHPYFSQRIGLILSTTFLWLGRQGRRWPNQLFAVSLLATVVPLVSGQTGRPRSNSYAFSVAVTQIGDAAISSQPQRRSGPEVAVVHYYVNHREVVTGRLAGTVPAGIWVHPLVRRGGQPSWEVQADTLGGRGSSNGAFWKAEVRFGDQVDEGEAFEFKVIASREPLPIGHVSYELIARNAAAVSDLIRLRRRVTGKVESWIASVNGIPVYDGTTKAVELQAQIDVKAKKLPATARIGLTVQPVKPWVSKRWVMDGFITATAPRGSTEGVLYGVFGRPEMDMFYEFEVTAFATWPEHFPRPATYDQEAWDRLRNNFLAESRSVKVTRWYGEFQITHIDDYKVPPSRIPMRVDDQVDIAGTVDQEITKIKSPKIWLICLPKKDDPWVAGWTDSFLPAGRWVIQAAQLLKAPAQTRSFDLLAVVSVEKPPEGPALRQWIYQVRRTRRSVRVVVTPSADR